MAASYPKFLRVALLCLGISFATTDRLRGALQAYKERMDCVKSPRPAQDPVTFESYMKVAPTKLKAALATGSLSGLSDSVKSYEKAFKRFPECVTDKLEGLYNRAGLKLQTETSATQTELEKWYKKNGFGEKDSLEQIEALSAITGAAEGENMHHLVKTLLQERRLQMEKDLDNALDAITDVKDILERYDAVAKADGVEAGVKKEAIKQKKIVAAALQKAANTKAEGQFGVAAAMVGLDQQASRMTELGEDAEWGDIEDLVARTLPIKELLTLRGVEMPKQVNLDAFNAKLAAVESMLQKKVQAAQQELDDLLADAEKIADTEDRLRAMKQVLTDIDRTGYSKAKAAYVDSKLEDVTLQLEEFLIGQQEEKDEASFKFLLGGDKDGVGFEMKELAQKISACDKLRRCPPASCTKMKGACPAAQCGDYKIAAESGVEVEITKGVVKLANEACFQFYNIEKLNAAMKSKLELADSADGTRQTKTDALKEAAKNTGDFWAQVMKEDRTRFMLKDSADLKAQCMRKVAQLRNVKDKMDETVQKVQKSSINKSIKQAKNLKEFEAAMESIKNPGNGEDWRADFDVIGAFEKAVTKRCGEKGFPIPEWLTVQENTMKDPKLELPFEMMNPEEALELKETKDAGVQENTMKDPELELPFEMMNPEEALELKETKDAGVQENTMKDPELKSPFEMMNPEEAVALKKTKDV